MPPTITALNVVAKKVEGKKVKFEASDDCLLQFTNKKMFKTEFMVLKKGVPQVVPYFEEETKEESTKYYIYTLEQNVMSGGNPGGPIT